MSKNFRLDLLVVALPLPLVLAFTIAVIDPNYRQPFIDLTRDFLYSLVFVLGRSGAQRKLR
jgi:hypothetical protein